MYHKRSNLNTGKYKTLRFFVKSKECKGVLITVDIWFKETRNRTFLGLIDKLKIKFKKYDPRISKADELKKYAELRDKGIITEEEFQAKKKKLLDL